MICTNVIIYKILFHKLTIYPDSSLCIELELHLARCKREKILSKDPPIEGRITWQNLKVNSPII